MLKQTVQEEIFRRLHEVEKRLTYIESREEDGWKAASDQVDAAMEASRSGTNAIANLELKLAKDIEAIERTLATDLQAEVQQRNQSEAILRQLVSDEAQSAKNTMEQLSRTREQELELQVKELTQKLSDLCGNVEERFKELRQEVVSSVGAVSQEAARVEELLRDHQRIREESQMNLLQLLEDMCVRLHEQLVEEKKERVESQKRLEKLLLEYSSRQWVRT